MYNIEKDVITGVVCLVALFGFFSGEFVVSTVLFGAATVLSNLSPVRQLPTKRFN